uniref:Uncharacterized protein n=1 Tax=Arundo donax TaxID=35708 RepID=A0A0A9A0F3_ARUDO
MFIVKQTNWKVSILLSEFRLLEFDTTTNRRQQIFFWTRLHELMYDRLS